VSGSQDLVLAALHWVEYLGLLAGLGSMVVRRLARNRPTIRWADPPMHIALGLAFLGGLAVITFEGLHAGAVPGWAHLARVAAEGLANVLKHSGATEATVTITSSDSCLRIAIADDGHGFDRVGARESGLRGLRDRVEALGGHVEIDSSRSGTRLNASLPAVHGSDD